MHEFNLKGADGMHSTFNLRQAHEIQFPLRITISHTLDW